MDNLVLIKYNDNDIDLNYVLEETEYLVKFDMSKFTSVVYPGNIEYYNEKIRQFNKCVIPMVYKGISRVDGQYLFEVNPNQIIRNMKINSILDE